MNKNIPEIRFKGFSDEWEQRKLGELIENQTILLQSDGNHGELYPKSTEFSETGIPYLSASNIDLNTSTIDFSSSKYLPINKAKIFKKGIAKNGDILLAHNATVGPTVMLSTDYPFVVLSTTLTLFRINQSKMNPNFFLYKLRSVQFQNALKKMMKQTTRNQVPILTQRNIDVSYPNNIDEQAKLGIFFKQLDETIALHQQKFDLLKQSKIGFLQKMFPKKGESVPGIRFSNIDKRWNRIRLKELVQYRSSKYSSNQFNGDAKQGAFPVFDANNTIAWIEEYDEEQDYLSIIKDGAGVGRMVKRPGKSSIIGTMGYLITEEQNIDFIHAVLQKVNFTKFIVGSTIPHIYFKDYGNLKIRIPSLEEQQKIGEIFKQLDNKMKLHEEKLNSLNQIKKSFLQKMFV